MSQTDSCTNDCRELVLVKAGQRYVFRYARGQESGMLQMLANSARDPQVDFDWFDAAVLSHQMGDRMSAQLKTLINE